MSIWSYRVNRIEAERDVYGAPPLFFEAHNLPDCPYCQEPLRMFRRYCDPNETGARDYMTYLESPKKSLGDESIFRGGSPLGRISVIDHITRVCPTCGWWIAFEESVQRQGSDIVVSAFGGVGGLIEFDVGGLDVPLRDLRNYLVAKYDARFAINPRVFEDAVASVFHDRGYRARVTAFSGDDGIDVVLDGPDDKLIGVQVKRHASTISVEQLRSLVGALVINGMTSGVFVTTSDFTSGAPRTVDLAAARGIRVDLYDAARFYDALKLAQRTAYESADEPGAPFAEPLPLLRSSVVAG